MLRFGKTFVQEYSEEGANVIAITRGSFQLPLEMQHL